jgi:hypothetical protein
MGWGRRLRSLKLSWHSDKILTRQRTRQ